MASFTVYDPKLKSFRPLETSSEGNLTLEEILLVNILIELRVVSEYLSNQSQSAGETQDDVDEIRQSMVEETA